jgi:hypothetical protein
LREDGKQCPSTVCGSTPSHNGGDHSRVSNTIGQILAGLE